MNYPSKIITIGEQDAAIVKQIQTRLNALKCGPVPEDGIFGVKTIIAIAAYQSWHYDLDGKLLEDDGKVGPRTWWSLFDDVAVLDIFSSPLLFEVIDIACKQIGIMKDPPGSNKGPTVSAYLKSVSLNPGYP